MKPLDYLSLISGGLWVIGWITVSYAVYSYCIGIWRTTAAVAVKWWSRVKVCGVLLGLCVVIGAQGKEIIKAIYHYLWRQIKEWLITIIEHKDDWDLDLRVMILGIVLILQIILLTAWIISGVRTRISRGDVQRGANSTVVINPGIPMLNATTLEDLAKAVAMILHPREKKDQQPVSEDKEILPRILKTQEMLTTMITTLQAEVKNLPQVTTITSTFMNIADIIQEEGVNTRDVMRTTNEILLEGRDNEIDDGNEETPEVMMISTYNDEIPMIAVAKEVVDIPTRKTQGVKPTPIISKSVVQPAPRTPKGFSQMKLQDPNMRPYTQADMTEFVGKTQAEIIQLLQQKEKERKDKLKAPTYLTQAEKDIGKESLAALDRSWRANVGQPLRPTHYIEIGALSDEQITLPRQLIKQLIQQRRDAGFIDRAKQEGKEAITCDKCRRLYLQGMSHNCFIATGWTTNTQRDGVPTKRELLVTQAGGKTIQIRPQVGVDTQRLRENYQKLARYKLVLDDQPIIPLNTTLVSETLPSTAAIEQTTENMQLDTNDTNLVVNIPQEAETPSISAVMDVSIEGRNFRLVPC